MKAVRQQSLKLSLKIIECIRAVHVMRHRGRVPQLFVVAIFLRRAQAVLDAPLHVRPGWLNFEILSPSLLKIDNIPTVKRR